MENVKESVAGYHNAVTEKSNTPFFSIEQTVEIPADRRLHLDFEVPIKLPTGQAHLELKIIPFVKKKEKTVLKEQANNMLRTGIAVSATPITDSLVGILSHVGDITLEEIREERLAKYLE